ncbi:inactive serine/threonine-protein kinase PLK5 isoform X4 [Suricata suricatta]|uniref:inactive serine/threonine-protein kinase PLK5 isoform X4 n=1 Tax=Suricata suricatta TaxID=37032 RepID=UPI001155FA69|nr:inactive serine/threonine-protein kinase PLK5 isoform X4 [Suricata suricatta]
MEPGPRRRRCRPPVSTFLRDPSSGRVYRRGKLIGKGAFSRCYKLMDMSTSAVFALKVVPRGGGGAGRLRPLGKVEREIALHSRLRHRNIVAFHGHFSDRDHVYMVLEYCSRRSLAHVLEARRTLTEPEVRYYLRGLVSGLRYLHHRRIVHRDLKLSNFFLNKNMVVKIGDLGLAARAGPGGRCHRVLCGTPNFLAPEVISRNGHSCQSDIWALGCIMYTALTGAPPFPAAPLPEMYQNIRASRYPEPAHLSPSARRLIARLLAPNPAERPSLDRLLQDDFFTASPQTGCRPTPATAHPSSPGPSLWAGWSGRWAGCCWPSAGLPAPAVPTRPQIQELVLRILTPWSEAGRPPCWTEGLPALKCLSTCSPTAPSGATQQPHRAARESSSTPSSGPPGGLTIPASTASAISCRMGAAVSCFGMARTWPCAPWGAESATRLRGGSWRRSPRGTCPARWAPSWRSSGSSPATCSSGGERRRAGRRPPPRRPPASACCASWGPSGLCCCSSATGRCR